MRLACFTLLLAAGCSAGSVQTGNPDAAGTPASPPAGRASDAASSTHPDAGLTADSSSSSSNDGGGEGGAGDAGGSAAGCMVLYCDKPCYCYEQCGDKGYDVYCANGSCACGIYPGTAAEAHVTKTFPSAQCPADGRAALRVDCGFP